MSATLTLTPSARSAARSLGQALGAMQALETQLATIRKRTVPAEMRGDLDALAHLLPLLRFDLARHWPAGQPLPSCQGLLDELAGTFRCRGVSADLRRTCLCLWTVTEALSLTLDRLWKRRRATDVYRAVHAVWDVLDVLGSVVEGMLPASEPTPGEVRERIGDRLTSGTGSEE